MKYFVEIKNFIVLWYKCLFRPKIRITYDYTYAPIGIIEPYFHAYDIAKMLNISKNDFDRVLEAEKDFVRKTDLINNAKNPERDFNIYDAYYKIYKDELYLRMDALTVFREIKDTQGCLNILQCMYIDVKNLSEKRSNVEVFAFSLKRYKAILSDPDFNMPTSFFDVDEEEDEADCKLADQPMYFPFASNPDMKH